MSIAGAKPLVSGRLIGQPVHPAPVSGWRRMLSDSLLVSGSAAVCQVLAVGTSLLLRAALDPAQMGIWQALKMLLSYSNYANLGISKGAARELTVALGRGDAAAAERGLSLAFTVNTIGSLLVAAVLAGSGAWIGISRASLCNNPWAIGLMALAVMVVLQRHVSFRVTILRCRQAFAATALLSLLEGVLTLGVAAWATSIWGLPGLYAGTLLVLVSSLVYLRRRNDQPFAWIWDRREIARLISIGGPILLSGIAATLLQSLDKLMILGYSTDREYQLGCYSLALLVSGQLYGLANMLSLAMGPRYGELFGRSGSRRQVALLAARASELQGALLGLLGGLALVAAVPVLGRMLPDYEAGLAPSLWVVPGAVAMGLSLPANQFLVAVYRERRVLAALLAATALAAVCNHWALVGGFGLRGVAMATSMAYAAYLTLMVAISLWPELDGAARCRYALGLGLTLGPTLGLALLLETIRPSGPGDWGLAAGKALAVLACWCVTVVAGWQLGGWTALWREEAEN